MLIHNRIQLRSDFREVPIQVQRLYADLVSTHLIYVVRLDGFIRPGIEQHAGYRMRLCAKFGVLILHIGENLV